MAPASSFIPLMVSRRFGGDALELGWMQSAIGFGVVAGGLLLGAWGGFRNRSVTAVVALFLRGAGLLALGLTPPTAFPMALAAAFFYNACSPLIDGSILAILQGVVPNALLGRVMTILHSGFALSVPFGMAIGGPLADHAGVSVCFIGAGILTALSALVALTLPDLMQLGRPEPHNAAPVEPVPAVD